MGRRNNGHNTKREGEAKYDKLPVVEVARAAPTEYEGSSGSRRASGEKTSGECEVMMGTRRGRKGYKRAG